MSKILFKKKTIDEKSIYYEILENGFRIYIGNKNFPSIEQLEPYIPDEDKTYEENAIDMCESLCSIQKESKDFNTRLTTVEANMDYLMLLNDPDSVTETTTE